LAARRGFTLVELLTVIGIILFLIAVIVGVFIRYGEMSKVRATQKLIERVGIGLARYKAELRSFPPDTGYGMPKDTKKDGDLVLYDSGALWRYLGKEVVKYRADGTIVATYGPYMSFTPGELLQYEDSVYGTSYCVMDAWYNPLGYVGDPKRVIHNRGDFDLYSAGPNKKTAGDDGLDNNPADTIGGDAANNAYGGGDGTVVEMGEAALNGTLTGTKKTLVTGEVLDDLNNWDPQQ
jgi:prepilin-type N-terminal cleavage/methylation domain-containing protein